MKKIKKYLILCLSCGLSLSSVFSIHANQVPQAIKYQAVIRDLNGQVISERNDIDVKISIHLQYATGKIVYSEIHSNIESNAYGMIHLEIGRGVSTKASPSFDKIDWGAGSHYVQVEVQIAGQGFTQMGMAELLSVPYALYAATSGDSVSFAGLRHDMLPKYDTASRTLVNTSISQAQDGSLVVVSPSVRFFNPKAKLGYQSYTFPSELGLKGQVLYIQDAMGTLAWTNNNGGGSGGGSDLTHLKDRYYPYWDISKNNLIDGSIKQIGNTLSVESDLTLDKTLSVQQKTTFQGEVLMQQPLQLDNNFIFNGSLSGTNTIQKNTLATGRIWVGDAKNVSSELSYKFPISVSSNPFQFLGTNGQKDTLVWRSFETKGNISINKDTLCVIPNASVRLSVSSGDVISLDSNAISISSIPMSQFLGVWKSKADTIYNNGDLNKTCVAIGTSQAKAKLHLENGNMLIKNGSFTSTSTLEANAVEPYSGAGIRMMWHGKKAAFRAGGVEGLQWDGTKLGLYSTAFGKNSIAEDYAFAAGLESQAGKHSIALGNTNIAKDSSMVVGMHNTGESAFVMALGYKNTVSAPGAFALGHDIKIDATTSTDGGTYPASYSFAIGRDNKIQSPASFAIGKEVEINGTKSNQIALGNQITIEESSNAIAIGSGLLANSFKITKATSAIGIGRDVNMVGNNSIAIGQNVSVGKEHIAIGGLGTGTSPGTSIKGGQKSIAIGYNNTLNAAAGYMVALGSNLQISENTSVGIGKDHEIRSGGIESVVIGKGIVCNRNRVIAIGSDLNVLDINNCTVLGYIGGNNPIHTVSSSLLSPGDGEALIVLGGEPSTSSVFKGITLLGTRKGDLKIPGDYYGGASHLTSDIRLKENINPLVSNLTILDSISPVTYNFIADQNRKMEIGFIAQDVQRYFPSLVSQSGGFLYLNYTGLIPVLWKYTQEQQKKIVSQQAQIDELKVQLEAIKASIQELKK